MKTFTLCILTAACAFALATTVRSQAPGQPKTPLQLLQDIKTKNEKQLEQQTATLLKLDEVSKQAEQMRFMVKRG